MAYKSLLTILTHPDQLETALGAAIEMARQQDAHLEVLCMGIDQTQAGYFYAGTSGVAIQAMLDAAQDHANTLEASARTRLAREDIRWSAESLIAQMGAIGYVVSSRARFADLVLLPQPYAHPGQPEAEAVLEATLLEAHAPILVLPKTGLPENFGQRILIGWDESQVAMRAIRAALPILRAAAAVTITVIDPPRHSPERSDPGGALSQMLARHGVRADVATLAKTLPQTSDILNRHVSDINADMVVIGGYGHARLREAILGGATRGMLETATVPVFMAH